MLKNIIGSLLILIALTSCDFIKKTQKPSQEKTKSEKSIKTQEITYSDGEVEMHGYLASPQNIDTQAPGVLVVHEWWGQTDYPRKKARDLAQLGYIALAVDMYGQGQTTDHPKTAGEFSQKVMKDLPKAKARFQAAMEVLKKQNHVDPTRINAIGYCFGGAVVLTMAREGMDLKSVVSLHGSLPSNDFQAQNVKANVLVLNGAEDPFIKADSLKTFEEQMKSIPTEFKLVNLEGATHGFSNPEATKKGEKFGLPLKYSAEADKESWLELKNFLVKSNDEHQ